MEHASSLEPGPSKRRSIKTRRVLLRDALVLSPLLILPSWAGSRGRAASAGTAATGAGRSSQGVSVCVVTPRQTEGPYFVDESLNRSDIRSDPASGAVKQGVPLRLGFRITQIGGDSGCAPLAGAVVDVWHCDALGVYSDVRDPGFDTEGQKFLRGYQVTDENGYAEFLTIYPGWYQGRAVHIHFKIRTRPGSSLGYELGYEFTSQLYYDDALTDRVHAQPPYAAKGQRNMRNGDDGIFRDGGQQLLLVLSEDNGGYTATKEIGVDLRAATPSRPSD